MFEQRFTVKYILANVDWVLMATVILLLCFSLVALSTATREKAADASGRSLIWTKQALGAVMGIGVMLFLALFDYSLLTYLAWPLYVLKIGLLTAVLVAGRTAMGAQRWLKLGPLDLQPSEIAKLLCIIALAHYLTRKREGWNSWLEMVVPLALVTVPAVLVLKQPDLGTALVFWAIAFGMMFISGAPKRPLVTIVLLGVSLAVGALVLHLKYGIPIPLQDYQIKRLVVFVNPEIDPLNTGYQVIQSRIAIGSGQLFGRGLYQGTQAAYFLPEAHTDFIFSVVGEEAGFVGGSLLLLLFLILILRAVSIAQKSKDEFGTLLAIGIATMLVFQVTVNVGMTLGIMPVTGIPFPFMTAGVSSLTTTMASMGILQSIYLRRRKIVF